MQHRYLLLFSFLVFSSISYAETTISLVNWEDYLSPRVIEAWKERTGANIDEIYIDNDVERDSIMLNAHKHKIDIAVMDEVSTFTFGGSGRLIELNEENIPNLKLIEPRWRKHCGKHGIPYFWGTLGIAYRTDKITTPPTSWRDILEPAEHLQGHISMLSDYNDMLTVPLLVNKAPLFGSDPADLEKAFIQLKAQTKHILTYEYGITYLQTSPSAEQLYMAQAYGGDQYTMNNISGKDIWNYVVPKEGSILWVDCLSVSSFSENIELSLAFLNFLHEPNIALMNATDSAFATPNIEAYKLLDESIQTDQSLYPPNEVLERSVLYQPVNDEIAQLRQRIVNAVLKIYESK